MARKYAVSDIPGLRGDIKTYVDGEYIPAGEPLPEGTETFDVTVHYRFTPADVEAGAVKGGVGSVSLHGIGLNESIYDIRAAVIELRAKKREEKSFSGEYTMGFLA
jgi:hypothetical protein